MTIIIIASVLAVIVFSLLIGFNIGTSAQKKYDDKRAVETFHRWKALLFELSGKHAEQLYVAVTTGEWKKQ